MQPRDSLGGQNSYRRVSGARSSRALSTIFKQLQKIDRKISKLDHSIRLCPWSKGKLKRQREILDAKRKEIRHKRKGTEKKS